MKLSLNPEIVVQIEQLTAQFMNLFQNKMEKCADEFEYFNLLISAMVFKNLVTHHFDSLLKEEGSSSKEIIDHLQQAATVISQKITKAPSDSQMLN